MGTALAATAGQVLIHAIPASSSASPSAARKLAGSSSPLKNVGSSAETVGMNEWLDSSAAPIGTFGCVLAMRIGIKPGAFGAPLCGYGA
jgi:hypothetical protein